MKCDNYIRQFEDMEKVVKIYHKRSNFISTIRLVFFVCAAITLIIGVVDSNFVLFLFGTLFTVLFFVTVVYHKNVIDYENYITARTHVLERYMMRFSDGWKNFPDTGEDFLSKDDTVAYDLDILGKNSLFQFINCGNTIEGRKRLAKSLSKNTYEFPKNEDIIKRNKAINELMEDENFVLNFETLSIKMRDKHDKPLVREDNNFIKNCSDVSKKVPLVLRVLKVIMPLGLFGLLVGCLGFDLSYSVLAVYFIVALGTSWLTSSITNSVLMPLFSFSRGMEQYIYMMDAIATSEFKSELLVELREDIKGNGNAFAGIRKLSAIGNAFNLRYNPIIHQFLNGTILWDLWIAGAMEKWKKDYGIYVEKWIDAVAIMEELISLSVIGRTRDTTFSHLENTTKPEFHGKDMYHPLIITENAISNSINIKGETIVITGSNMSGKTTFLRTIGMNLVLAYAGAPVCASELNAGIMNMFTSMRVVDDVSSGISTFYAEILRIKSMVERSNLDAPMICLIDEIFKGTNSADRIIGAKAVIEKLSKDNCITLVSTHDFELCDMANEHEDILNYHFQEYYEGDSLKFDYQLREGRCTTTNALKLMSMAGIR